MADTKTLDEIGELLELRASTAWGHNVDLDSSPLLTGVNSPGPLPWENQSLVDEVGRLRESDLFFTDDDYEELTESCTLDTLLTMLLGSDPGLADCLALLHPPAEVGYPFLVTFQGKQVPEPLRVQPVFYDPMVLIQPKLASMMVGAWVQLRYQLAAIGDNGYPPIEQLMKRHPRPLAGTAPSGGTVAFFKDLLPGCSPVDRKLKNLSKQEIADLAKPSPQTRVLRIYKGHMRNAAFLTNHDAGLADPRTAQDKASLLEISWRQPEDKQGSLASMTATSREQPLFIAPGIRNLESRGIAH